MTGNKNLSLQTRRRSSRNHSWASEARHKRRSYEGCFFPTSLCGVLVFDSVSRSRPPRLPTIFVTHHLSHTTLSHTIFDTPFFTPLCHTPSFTRHLCHTPSFTHHFVTHHLSHTIFDTPSFTHYFVTHHLGHTIFVTHPLSHTFVTHHLSHTTLSPTIFDI